MGLQQWKDERAQLQAVVNDLASGQIRLEQGQEEYLASLKRRIAELDEKIRDED